MENMDLGTLIVAGLCGIGLIQFTMWIVVIIRHPGLDDVRLELVKPPSSSESTLPYETRSVRVEQ